MCVCFFVIFVPLIYVIYPIRRLGVCPCSPHVPAIILPGPVPAPGAGAAVPAPWGRRTGKRAHCGHPGRGHGVIRRLHPGHGCYASLAVGRDPRIHVYVSRGGSRHALYVMEVDSVSRWPRAGFGARVLESVDVNDLFSDVIPAWLRAFLSLVRHVSFTVLLFAREAASRHRIADVSRHTGVSRALATRGKTSVNCRMRPEGCNSSQLYRDYDYLDVIIYVFKITTRSPPCTIQSTT